LAQISLVAELLRRHELMGDCKLHAFTLEFLDYEGAVAFLHVVEEMPIPTTRVFVTAQAIDRKVNAAIVVAAQLGGGSATLLKQTRSRLGMTQLELAKRLQVKRNTVSQYEASRAEPSLEVLMRVFNLLPEDHLDLRQAVSQRIQDRVRGSACPTGVA